MIFCCQGILSKSRHWLCLTSPLPSMPLIILFSWEDLIGWGVIRNSHDWFKSYLTGRCQRIKRDDCLSWVSSKADLHSGVSQGSGLNWITHGIKNHWVVHLFFYPVTFKRNHDNAFSNLTETFERSTWCVNMGSLSQISASVGNSSVPVAFPSFIDFNSFCISSSIMHAPLATSNLRICSLWSSYNSVIYSTHLAAVSSWLNSIFRFFFSLCIHLLSFFGVLDVSSFTSLCISLDLCCFSNCSTSSHWFWGRDSRAG